MYKHTYTHTYNLIYIYMYIHDGGASTHEHRRTYPSTHQVRANPAKKPPTTFHTAAVPLPEPACEAVDK